MLFFSDCYLHFYMIHIHGILDNGLKKQFHVFLKNDFLNLY